MKKIFSILMVAMMMVVATGCTNEDEPAPPVFDGVSVYINVTNTLYKDGKPAFTPTETEGLYLAQAESKDATREYIARLIEKENYCGRDLNVPLGKDGEEGSLKIVGTDLPDGVYYELFVNIRGDEENYPPFTLRIISEEMADSENGVHGEVVIKI